MKIRTEIEIDLDINTAARWFAGLDDEQQAEFFIQVASEASKWPQGFMQSQQWWSVGRHLRTCECSTRQARELIKNLWAGMSDET